jgi:ADP-ribose diphosphatase
MDGKYPKILDTSISAKTDRLEIERVHLRFSNNEERFYERSLSKNGSVLVLPFLDEETFLLVREYAVGVEKYCLGFPKGAIDPGESCDQAALRELKEEVGYGARQLKPLIDLGASPAYSNHMIHVYVASDLYVERLQGDEPEPLDVIPWKVSDIDRLIAHPDFIEARSMAVLLLWLRKNGEH